MRKLFWGIAIGIASTASTVEAQMMVPPQPWARPSGRPTGNYGMAHGVPSYGVVRTYSEFSSPYGVGYHYGYPPATYLPGSYGVGLWRPAMTPGYVWGSAYYRAYPAPYRSRVPAYAPSVGYYAPGFGPRAGWGR